MGPRVQAGERGPMVVGIAHAQSIPQKAYEGFTPFPHSSGPWLFVCAAAAALRSSLLPPSGLPLPLTPAEGGCSCGGSWLVVHSVIKIKATRSPTSNYPANARGNASLSLPLSLEGKESPQIYSANKVIFDFFVFVCVYATLCTRGVLNCCLPSSWIKCTWIILFAELRWLKLQQWLLFRTG